MCGNASKPTQLNHFFNQLMLNIEMSVSRDQSQLCPVELWKCLNNATSRSAVCGLGPWPQAHLCSPLLSFVLNTHC